MNPLIDSKLQELLTFAKEHDLAEISWQDKALKIAFRRGGQPLLGTPQTVAESSENGEVAPVEKLDEVIRSPMVGKFRRSLAKDRPPMVVIGNHIKPGDRVAVVECMKIPTEVVSFCAGQITKILVEEGQPVEYGQPLFAIKEMEVPSGIEKN